MTRISEIATHKTALVSTDMFLGEEGGGGDFYTEFADLLASLSASLSDWVEVADTWTYASASTITVPSDATLVYQKGDRIRLKQGGSYKYYYVVGVGASLLTVTGGTDYTVANSPITDIAYSRAVRPFGFPFWFNWAPTISAGSGSITSYTINSAKFRLFGRECKLDLDVTITNNGTGASFVAFTRPIAETDTILGYGRERASGGKQLQVYAGNIYNYDNSYPAATGYRLTIHASYGI